MTSAPGGLLSIDWVGIEAQPRFRELHRRKSRFLWGLMAFSIVYYFLLPIGAAYWTELFRRPVWGPVNVGLLFGLSEFVVAWLVAFLYSRHASRNFDAMAEQLRAEAEGDLAARHSAASPASPSLTAQVSR
jgi:uncharacterized membrane protein (DUF485 family)